MRPKHYAVFALAAWLAVVGWIGSMVVGKPQAFIGRAGDVDATAAAQIQLEIQRAEQVREALAALATQPSRAVPRGGVVAEPPPAPEAAGIGPGTAVAAGSQPTGRVVSMILSGVGIPSRALIDGRMVGTGAQLDDGGIVRAIGPRSVRIEESDGRTTTLALRTPGDAPPAMPPGGGLR